MLLILKMVAAILIAFFVLLVVLYFVIRWKVKSWSEGLAEKFGEAIKNMGALAAAGVPPMRIELMRLEGHEWSNAEKIDELTASFLDAGFKQLGDYEVNPAMMEVRGFLHESSKTLAALNEHSMAGIWFDLVSYTSGCKESFSYTTSEQAGMMDVSPGRQLKVITALTTPKKAFEKYLSERPQKDWVAIPAADFVKTFEEAYAREMDWRMSRGGPTEEEIRRIAERDGNEVTEESVTMIRRAWAVTASNFYRDGLHDEFLKQNQMSAQDWEEIRDRLMFVHAHTTAEDMLHAVTDFLDDDVDDGNWEALVNQLQKRVKKSTPQQVFVDLLKEKSLAGRFRLRGQMSKPLAADVYVTPEYDED